MYKISTFDSIIRLADHSSIPLDPRNRDYQDYLAWVAEGNTPLPVDPPPPPPPPSVTALQGMRAIAATGLVAAFLEWKAGLDPVTDFETIAFLDKAQTWVYDDPILNAALIALGIEAQKDALFTLAGTL